MRRTAYNSMIQSGPKTLNRQWAATCGFKFLRGIFLYRPTVLCHFFWSFESSFPTSSSQAAELSEFFFPMIQVFNVTWTESQRSLRSFSELDMIQIKWRFNYQDRIYRGPRLASPRRSSSDLSRCRVSAAAFSYDLQGAGIRFPKVMPWSLCAYSRLAQLPTDNHRQVQT